MSDTPIMTEYWSTCADRSPNPTGFEVNLLCHCSIERYLRFSRAPSVCADSTVSHLSHSIPSGWPQEPLSSSVQRLNILKTPTKQCWPGGCREVDEYCCNLYYSCSNCPKFLLLQQTAWMLCFLEDKGSLPWKVTKQSNTDSFSCDKSYCMGPEGSGKLHLGIKMLPHNKKVPGLKPSVTRDYSAWSLHVHLLR